jgi:hypothetical protein
MDKASYKDTYTKGHMTRDIYAIAQRNAKAQNRTVANYIAKLVLDDDEGSADAAPVRPAAPKAPNVDNVRTK